MIEILPHFELQDQYLNLPVKDETYFNPPTRKMATTAFCKIGKQTSVIIQGEKKSSQALNYFRFIQLLYILGLASTPEKTSNFKTIFVTLFQFHIAVSW